MRLPTFFFAFYFRIQRSLSSRARSIVYSTIDSRLYIFHKKILHAYYHLFSFFPLPSISNLSNIINFNPQVACQGKWLSIKDIVTIVFLTLTYFLLFPLVHFSRYYKSPSKYLYFRTLHNLCRCNLLYLLGFSISSKYLIDMTYSLPFSRKPNFSCFYDCELTSYANLLDHEVISLFVGKSILILGPSDLNVDEINVSNYDVVCIPNSLYSKITFKSKSVVLFLNIGYLLRHPNKQFFSDSQVLAVLQKPGSHINLYPHFLLASQFMVNDYGPMALQNILLTVAACKPSRIALKGFDAYSSHLFYRPNIKNYPPNIQHYSNNLRVHEPFSNFIFIKSLSDYLSLYIPVDLCAPFSSDISLYALKLDHNFSHYPYSYFDSSSFGSN